MNTAHISAVAGQFIDTFDNGAHQVIDAWREGGERIAAAVGERWDSAFEQSKPQLTAETRRNATHAKKVFAGYYHKGVELSASGAEVAVNTVVQVARVAVDRAATWQQSRA